MPKTLPRWGSEANGKAFPSGPPVDADVCVKISSIAFSLQIFTAWRLFPTDCTFWDQLDLRPYPTVHHKPCLLVYLFPIQLYIVDTRKGSWGRLWSLQQKGLSTGPQLSIVCLSVCIFFFPRPLSYICPWSHAGWSTMLSMLWILSLKVSVCKLKTP